MSWGLYEPSKIGISSCRLHLAVGSAIDTGESKVLWVGSFTAEVVSARS